ncbi:ATP-dependent DNA helicase, RecQ family [Candidatus Vecturithrix granuli]|uniref:DNA 3'-5' helicase n=1 Tax=Vecturithrix granuli TaxID=1499967 RepID=A0A0S6W5B9_VECG1|nr:ATP-dependent DNA helicase, RecQ family [Candidatus Vecturithrix granuli]
MDLKNLLSRCLLLDIETTKQGALRHVGALFQGQTFERKTPFELEAILHELDQFAAQADFVLGHNLIGHDLVILQSLYPHLKLLDLPVIDTLYLSPLAFPQNPYHHLVKDYKLVRSALSDPLEDIRLAVSVFQDQCQAFRKTWEHAPEVLAFYQFCFFDSQIGMFRGQGVAEVFRAIGGALEPAEIETYQTIFVKKTEGIVCQQAVRSVTEQMLCAPLHRPALAYCLAWLLVSGSNSVLPPWVRYQFPKTGEILRLLRDRPCNDESCQYCQENHNPVTQLKRFFNFDRFRDTPQTEDGKSLQQAIVTHGMADQPLLAILPTGGGKSLCFQLPALVRHYRRGVLTVVISPLQALMKDQVDNLAKKTATPFADVVYGMLTPPERGAVLERVRLGDVAILYISPEQLRNRSVKRALQHREIGCWVFDEAHCLSKWGHDFRPDYLYAARFIREFAVEQGSPIPPIACFTATAKKDVIAEILEHFRSELQQELTGFEGGVKRENLSFEVRTVGKAEKMEQVALILEEHFRQADAGSVIIYAATRKETEEIRDYLRHKGASGFVVESFHAGLESQLKRTIIDDFVSDKIQVICATNAFGMGIDKENVRIVLHFDIPGSLENYIQEAGRAGRDLQDAHCMLLYDPQDVELQFSMNACSEIKKRDIAKILRGLRKTKTRQEGEIVLTVDELLREDEVHGVFEGHDKLRDTKVKTAVAWLERAGFLERNENLTQVFQGKPRVKNIQEGKAKIAQLNLSPVMQDIWTAILEELFHADPDEGLSADRIAEGLFNTGFQKIAEASGRTPAQEVIVILHEMANAGIVDQGVLLTAFLRPKGKNNARKAFEAVCALEEAMIKLLQEAEPDADEGAWVNLSLRRLNQRLINEGFESNPQTLQDLIKGLSDDGKGLAASIGSLDLYHISQDLYKVRLRRSWPALRKTANLRRKAANIILDVLIGKAAKQSGQEESPEGGLVLLPFSSNELTAAIENDLFLRAELRNMLAAIDRALLFLHEHHIITIQQGLAVFRQAMTIRLAPEAKGRRYTLGDYSPLAIHYVEKIFQVHIINAYAALGLRSIAEALRLVLDYFTVSRQEFIKKHFPGRENMLEYATSQDSFRKIVDQLRNAVQTAIVAGPLEKNLLVLAGPGSGKTKIVVHRCAYLLRVKRVPAAHILILCFNHNASVSLRKRLHELVGDDMRGVTILTYHSMALRLVGRSIAESVEKDSEEAINFDGIIREAIDLLKGKKEIIGIEADDLRDRLLAGYSHILVDEYQDIDQQQYELISVIAGRTLHEEEDKLSILAVGDDDQNIYTFRGANVEFIRKFQQDYQAREEYLVENYRSTRHIIAAANQLIQQNRDRMKTRQPIRINKDRQTEPPGGSWSALDPLAQGRVQIIQTNDSVSQAAVIIAEIQRLKALSQNFDWQHCAILARTRKTLDPIRALCEQTGIPVRWSIERCPPLHRIREIAHFLTRLQEEQNMIKKASELQQVFSDMSAEAAENPWQQLLAEMLEAYRLDTLDATLPVAQAIEWFYESLAEERRDKMLGRGVFLGTVHAAKGMEFLHVFLPGGDWKFPPQRAKQEEERRLLYVGMTRAMQTLCLFDCQTAPNHFLRPLHGEYLLKRSAPLLTSLDPHELRKQYTVLGLKDLYLDYAGAFPDAHAIHRHLTNLRTGDAVRLVSSNNGLQVHDNFGFCVTRLSNTANAAWRDKLDTIQHVRVLALIQRHAKDPAEDYRPRIKADHWELPLLEVVSG